MLPADRPAPPVYLPPDPPGHPPTFPEPTTCPADHHHHHHHPTPADPTARRIWITDADLAAAALRLAQLLPPHVGTIAAIPRSGCALAGLIACHRHLPLAELHPTAGLRLLNTGHRYTTAPRRPATHPAIAVIDDTVAGGTALAGLRPQLAALRATGRQVFVAVGFCNPALAHLVDFHAEPAALPHYLAWNFWNSIHAHTVAADFDGILCSDFPGSATDEGPRYWHHVTSAPCLAWPARPLAAIVSARLEKYRAHSTAWLHRHQIEAAELVLAPQATVEERAEHLNPGEYKGLWYATSNAGLFVESDPAQAATIARISRRPVLCPPVGLGWNC